MILPVLWNLRGSQYRGFGPSRWPGMSCIQLHQPTSTWQSQSPGNTAEGTPSLFSCIPAGACWHSAQMNGGEILRSAARLLPTLISLGNVSEQNPTWASPSAATFPPLILLFYSFEQIVRRAPSECHKKLMISSLQGAGPCGASVTTIKRLGIKEDE